MLPGALGQVRHAVRVVRRGRGGHVDKSARVVREEEVDRSRLARDAYFGVVCFLPNAHVIMNAWLAGEGRHQRIVAWRRRAAADYFGYASIRCLVGQHALKPVQNALHFFLVGLAAAHWCSGRLGGTGCLQRAEKLSLYSCSVSENLLQEKKETPVVKPAATPRAVPAPRPGFSTSLRGRVANRQNIVVYGS